MPFDYAYRYQLIDEAGNILFANKNCACYAEILVGDWDKNGKLIKDFCLHANDNLFQKTKIIRQFVPIHSIDLLGLKRIEEFLEKMVSWGYNVSLNTNKKELKLHEGNRYACKVSDSIAIDFHIENLNFAQVKLGLFISRHLIEYCLIPIVESFFRFDKKFDVFDDFQWFIYQFFVNDNFGHQTFFPQFVVFDNSVARPFHENYPVNFYRLPTAKEFFEFLGEVENEDAIKSDFCSSLLEQDRWELPFSDEDREKVTEIMNGRKNCFNVKYSEQHVKDKAIEFVIEKIKQS